MGMMQEFREFALKGNVMDLAVGVIIGGAFGKIVDSMVRDVIMPLVNFIAGGQIDFCNMYAVLGEIPAGTANTLDALKKAGVPVFAWGNFITILINFILMAFVIFMLVRYLNKVKDTVLGEEEKVATPPPPPPTEVLLAEIRDELKRRPV